MRLGLKASRHDIDTMMGMEPEFIETFLGRTDLRDHYRECVDIFSAVDVPVVVHVPEHEGDMLIDVSSADEGVRRASLMATRKALAFADDVSARYIVMHPGGVSVGDDMIGRGAATDRLKESLAGLGRRDIYLENMPWFYHGDRGDRGRCNIMTLASEFADVLDIVGGITLDVCHAFLCCKEGSMANVLDFFKFYPEVPMHLHISDAGVPDREGLQIGEGDIDMAAVLDAACARDVLAIPEIMGGHSDGGAGFREALERLRDQ